jgi:predicted N-acetyltransferase YhbS
MTSPPTLRTASGAQDTAVRALLEGAYARVDCETRLLEVLEAQDPAFDTGLALVAEHEGQAAGFALFTPRDLCIRGVTLPLAIAAPLAVSPARRGAGLGSFLLEAGRAALVDRGRLGVVTIGAPELFASAGYGSAFDMRFVSMPAEYLPEEGDTSAWRALCAEDLEALCALQLSSYREISGAELRRECALDWEGCAEGSFTLIHGAPGAPDAYLRFRRRDELEVTECGASAPAGVDAVLRLMRRLAREHATPTITAALAEAHPVARALYRRGGMVERCNFGGAAFLGVFDWAATFEALRPWWESLLSCYAPRGIELLVEGEVVVLGDSAPKERARLWIPEGWGPSLLTGQRSAEDLLFEPTVQENSTLTASDERLVRALFTRRDAAWTYGPAFELADN